MNYSQLYIVMFGFIISSVIYLVIDELDFKSHDFLIAKRYFLVFQTDKTSIFEHVAC